MTEKNIIIKTDKNSLEIIDYSFPDIRIAIQNRCLSEYAGMRATAHWHDDFEFIYVFEGEMKYDINGEIVLLKPGDLLFVNSERLHYGYSNNFKECKFLVLIFNNNLLKVNTIIYNKRVKNIINSALDYKIFNDKTLEESDYTNLIDNYISNIPSIDEVMKCFSRIEKNTDKINIYHILSHLFYLWSVVSDNIKLTEITDNSLMDDDLKLQKHMVSFIYDNYNEQITLDEIAAHANVSKSKCCRMFQRYMNESPILFLKDYRLRKSCDLLAKTDYSITEISTMVGYNHLSYYSKIFYQKYGMTPHDYRKKNKVKDLA